MSTEAGELERRRVDVGRTRYSGEAGSDRAEVNVWRETAWIGKWARSWQGFGRRLCGVGQGAVRFPEEARKALAAKKEAHRAGWVLDSAERDVASAGEYEVSPSLRKLPALQEEVRAAGEAVRVAEARLRALGGEP